VETKESPFSKITMPMPHIDTAIRERESSARFAVHIEKAANELVDKLIVFLNWPDFFVSPALSLSGVSTK
jgi:hypothetical protein